MKYLLGFISAVGILLIFLLCPFAQKEEVKYLRIHIRANSNAPADQAVKYLVKDAVVDALIPYLSEVKDFEEARQIVAGNFELIESVANDVLQENGFSYSSSASLKKEFFPARVYDELTLPEGEYEALILNLGSGEGNNWWCLVFPAFCFTSSTNCDNVEYISQIWEIIKSITGEEK